MDEMQVYKRVFHYLTGGQDGITVDAEKWFEYNADDLCVSLWEDGIKALPDTVEKETQTGDWSSRLVLRVAGSPRIKGVD